MTRKKTPGLLDTDETAEVLSPSGTTASTKKQANKKARKPVKKTVGKMTPAQKKAAVERAAQFKARRAARKGAGSETAVKTPAVVAPPVEERPVQVNFYLSPGVADELELAQLKLKRLAGKERGKVSKSALLEMAAETLIQALDSMSEEELLDTLPAIFAKKRTTRPGG